MTSNEIGKKLKQIFKENWKENFLFDGLNNKILTYEEFFSAILSYKKKLAEIDLKKNDLVCLLMPNSVDLIIMYFACLLNQSRVVPIDPQKGKNEILEILSASNYKKIIVEEAKIDLTSRTENVKEFRKNLKIKSNIEDLDKFTQLDYNKAFLTSFTSGSTGAPKGVMHSFKNLFLSASSFNERFHFNKKNIFYHILPMTYMAGILNLIILPFISESKIVLGERFGISNLKKFWDIPINYSVNTFWFVPTIIELLLKLDRGNKGIDFTKKNSMIGCVATAPLYGNTKIEFQNKYNMNLYESYGLSETLFVTTNYLGNDLVNSTGRTLNHVNLDFDNDEIIIQTPWMFLGYENIENKHAKVKFCSGDLGFIDKNGFLRITGREKDLILKGGVNISPKKIENFLRKFNIFHESAVLGFEERYLGEKTVCVYVSNKNYFSEEKKKKINLEIVDKLGKDYHIDEFVELIQIPKNATGKVDKPRIKQTFELLIKKRN